MIQANTLKLMTIVSSEPFSYTARRYFFVCTKISYKKSGYENADYAGIFVSGFILLNRFTINNALF